MTMNIWLYTEWLATKKTVNCAVDSAHLCTSFVLVLPLNDRVCLQNWLCRSLELVHISYVFTSVDKIDKECLA